MIESGAARSGALLVARRFTSRKLINSAFLRSDWHGPGGVNGETADALAFGRQREQMWPDEAQLEPTRKRPR